MDSEEYFSVYAVDALGSTSGVEVGGFCVVFFNNDSNDDFEND